MKVTTVTTIANVAIINFEHESDNGDNVLLQMWRY